MKTISAHYKNLLARPVAWIVHFNDVFSDQEIDFDAVLTTTFRNLWNFSDLHFPIWKNPRVAEYGVNLVNQLLGEQKRIISHIKNTHQDAVTLESTNNATICIVNNAPRDSQTTKDWKNGNDFHLAITDNWLEIYAVPLERLQALETRSKILALYRIPNEKLQGTDGSKEQFRSSIIAITRYFPEILEPIFEYENQDALLQAKKNHTHPQVIPEQKKLAEFAFADKFGNVRISVKNLSDFRNKLANKSIGDLVSIYIGDAKPLTVHYVKSLADIPSGKLGIYENIADDNNCESGYREIVKKSEDCNNDTETALYILTERNGSLSSEEIEIE
jgi:hypothetical protein